MGVRKIFIVLITIVVCVILGAFILNTVMPSTVKSISSATEDMIAKATGISLDLNGDGQSGSTTSGMDYSNQAVTDASGANNSTGVTGYN